MCGGDDQKAKRGVWMRDWRKLREQLAYVLDYVEPEGSIGERLRRLIVLNLPAQQLSKAARILAAADQLDALSAERPYRGRLPHERVVAIMKEEAGTGLCPDCVAAVMTVLERMPGDPFPQQ